jgi:hypothetical protein
MTVAEYLAAESQIPKAQLRGASGSQTEQR